MKSINTKFVVSSIVMLLVWAGCKTAYQAGINEPQRDASADASGPDDVAGTGGMVSTGGTTGTGGMVSMGGMTGTGGSDVPTGGIDGGASSVCVGAPCLASLYLACEPSGTCIFEGGASPSATYGTVCYSNGVARSYTNTYSGPNTISSATVSLNHVRCYSIDTSYLPSGGPISYVFRDGQGQQVATGIHDASTGTNTVTCNGSDATPVSESCLEPIGNSDACETAVLGTCP
jgi:hypothetical protein